MKTGNGDFYSPVLLILLVLAVFAGLLANKLESNAGGCTTDTECAEMFGGNGDPEPVVGGAL
jgi:hypothetical protein